MSFPNIPDINPEINLTCEDSINLLLTSIALEEISLSKLLDAEKDKVIFVIDECKHNKSTIKDVLEINKSVDQTIKDIIKLQMLLQFKLENVGDLLPCSTSTSSTSTTTTTTTTTHTTTSTTSTCSTTTRRECGCSLIGKIKGQITNKCDEFYNQTAVIQLFVFSCDKKNSSLQYTLQNCDYTISMRASEQNINTECPSCCNDKTVIYGKGTIVSSRCPHLRELIDFKLLIFKKSNGLLEFKMEIKSADNCKFNHDSGYVPFRNCGSELCIEQCC